LKPHPFLAALGPGVKGRYLHRLIIFPPGGGDNRGRALTGDFPCPIIACALSNMVKIRLSRTGAKNRPFYRIVVADSRAPRSGFIGVVGHYGPLMDPATIKIDREAVLAWLKKGAQPTDAVARLLARAGIGQESGEGK